MHAVGVECHAGDSFDKSGQHNEVRVTIDELGFRRCDGRLCECQAVRRVSAGEGGREIDIGGETGVVGEKITDRNITFAVLSEFRDVLHHRIVHSDSSLLFQLHDGGCSSDNFG